MTTIEQTGAAWLVIAGVCACNNVAVTVMDTRACDPNADAAADADEVVLYGEDWRDLVAPAALTMRARTGLRIADTCSVVFVPRVEFDKRTPREQQIYDELSGIIAAINDRRKESSSTESDDGGSQYV